MKPANAKELMSVSDVDGALVGGASLKAVDFLGIALSALGRQHTVRGELRQEARKLFAADDPPPIAVGWSASWHKGVVGVAAGRIAREHHVAAVVPTRQRLHRDRRALATDGLGSSQPGGISQTAHGIA